MFYTEPYAWKWVCCQHPMILISRDMSNPRALETVPPWGAESIHGYCQKMYDMLLDVARKPQLKIDFDLSAKELLLFLEEIADGRRILLQLISEGRVGFVGGDYSQAHYHEATSEAALRQIRMGMSVFEKELGLHIDVFQHQETGLFENLPQLLHAFGIRKAAVHAFPATFEFLDAPSLEITSNFGRLELVRKETFARWTGADGTEIPIYLPVVQRQISSGDSGVHITFENAIDDPDYKGDVGKPLPACFKYPTATEENRGLARNGSIIVECPDMVPVSDSYVQNRERVGTFWRLSEAIDEELKLQTRLPRIRYYTYWSYCEGVFGERMYKTYRACERKLLAAETMEVISRHLTDRAEPFDREAAWDLYLTAQHHDVNWMDTTELKQWCLAGMDRAVESANDYLQRTMRLLAGEAGSRYVTVFSTLPRARDGIARIGGVGFDVYDGKEKLPSQVIDGSLYFPVHIGGMGFRSYRLQTARNAPPVKQSIDDLYDFENDVMCVRVLKDGRIASLKSKQTGERLRGYGNLIRGKLVRDDKCWEWISNEDMDAHASVETGELFDIVHVDGLIADIPCSMKIFLPHGRSGRVDIELSLRFAKHTIGDFYHDESKLCVYWPSNMDDPDILLDEPFGSVTGKSDRPLHPASMLAITKNGKGIVYRHNGTPKHWVCKGTLANVFAWGGRNFSNRSVFGWSGMNIYDLRLDGDCAYRYSVEIAENADRAELLNIGSEYEHEFLTVLSEHPTYERIMMQVKNENLVVTAVEPTEDGMCVRFYEASGMECRDDIESEFRRGELTDAAGTPICGDGIKPYGIAQRLFR